MTDTTYFTETAGMLAVVANALKSDVAVLLVGTWMSTIEVMLTSCRARVNSSGFCAATVSEFAAANTKLSRALNVVLVAGLKNA